MRYFTHYWRRETYQKRRGRAEATGERTLRYVADNNFVKRGVAPGDVVYPISYFGKQLHLVGRLTVARIVGESEAQGELGVDNIWKATDYLLGPRRADDLLIFDSTVRASELDRIEFVATGPPARNQSGEVDKQTFRGIREITYPTAKLLDGWLRLDSQGPTYGSSSRLTVDAGLEELAALEGTPVEGRHLEFERDPRLRKAKVEQALARGALCCEVCTINFAEFYGPVGVRFMHVHHRLPLSESGPVRVELDDLALVCPNCHAMLHRDRSESVESLRATVEGRRAADP